MAKTVKELNEEIKVRFLEGVSEHLEGVGEEVLRVGSNEIALPVVDNEGNEKWLVLTFKVPTGSRDGEAYDGYSMAEDYSMKQNEKKRKAKDKADKAEKDKAKREAQARAKAQADAKALAELP
jgi:hypothetical protein